jgi:Cytochrome P450
LLGDLATACASGELDEVAAKVMMITLFSAGGESTAPLIGSAAWVLATRPDIQQQVRDRPELLGAFLEEVLRYEPPVRGHYRHVVSDTTLCGLNLGAGSRVLLLWGAANRDPLHFDDPNEFRLDRRNGKENITFGKGTHFCVGAVLARLEAHGPDPPAALTSGGGLETVPPTSRRSRRPTRPAVATRCRWSRRAVDMAIDIVAEARPPPASRLQNNLTRMGQWLAPWLSSLVSWPKPNTSS